MFPHCNALAMRTAIGDERPGKIFRGSAIEMDLGLTGKVAPATGANRGYGLALTQERTGKCAAEVHERHVPEINRTRCGAPDDIASLTAFMVSPRGRWLHGTTIDMDGGAGQAP
jgi:NAD(P)-dependent dehydrogenase (short-subunit alcohol dehydrogenase family)